MRPATITDALARLRPTRTELLFGSIVLGAQALAVMVYLITQPTQILQWRFVVYGLLWINVGLLAIAKTDLPAATTRTRRIGLAVAGGYLLVLAIAGGLVFPTDGGPLAQLLGFETGGHVTEPSGLSVQLLPPGWGPALIYQGAILTVVLLPYQVVGYLALTYLVFVTVIDAVGSSISGLLGIFTCVSCVWPLFGGVLTTLFGGGSMVAVAAANWPYDVSTIAFLLAVGLLYWRPTFGTAQ